MTEVVHSGKGYNPIKLVTKKVPVIEMSSEDKFESILLLQEGEGRQGEGGLRTQGFFKSSIPSKPLISIVTVVFNGEKYLEETILSVLSQTYENIEYIIVDGGSTDGTLNIIKKYEDSIDYWVSEYDKGIYDAMNKGLRLSQGLYFGAIGSDDMYYSNAIELITNPLSDNELVFGDITYIDASGLPLRNTNISMEEKMFMIKGMSIPHVGSFVKINTMKKYGLYSLNYKYASDYDYYLNLFLKGVDIKFIRGRITKFRNTGVTNTQQVHSNLESFKIRNKYKVKLFINLFYTFKAIVSKYVKAFF